MWFSFLGAASGYNSAPRCPEDDVARYGDEDDNYKYISKLITNIERIDAQTQLSNAVVRSVKMIQSRNVSNRVTFPDVCDVNVIFEE